MKNKSIIILLTILLFHSLTSCNSHGRLKEIDEIIELAPEKAMIALEQIQSEDLSSDDYAYYSLLYTQAQIKCGVVVYSDSLIRVAYEMYGRKNSGDLKKRTYFYNAKISYNNGNLKAAMQDVLVAYELAKDEEDFYWIAKSAELIGDIFFDAYNYKQSEIYTFEAVENYRKANKIANHRYALCDLATNFLNEDKDNEALSLLDSLYNIVKLEEPLDTALCAYIMTVTNSALFKTGRLEELDNGIFGHQNTEASKEEEIDVSIIKSYLLRNNGDFEGSSQLLSDAYRLADNEKQQIRIMYASYQQALATENYQQAAVMADSLLSIQSNIAEEMLKESVASVQRDFYSSKAVYQERKSKIIFYVLIAVVIIAIIITVLLVIIYRLKIQTKKAELDSNISSLLYFKEQANRIGSENKQLSNELTKKSMALESLQQKLDNKSQAEVHNTLVIEHLFKEKWNTLNMLCNDYFELGDSENTRAMILSNIEKELKKLRTKKNLKDIEIAVDTYMGNIMSMLREECSFLKEDDFTFLSLVFAGLSVRAVCLFTDMKYKLFYLKKSRLSKRILASDAPHKDLFLGKIR